MRVFLLLLTLLCLAPVLATEWVATPSAVATIYMQPGEQQIARQIGEMAGEECARLVGPLGVKYVADFPIFAYTNRAAFLHDAGPRPLLLGVSYRPSGAIRIDVTGSEGPVRSVLAHELTHTLLNQRLGPYIGSLPSWVNEGIAGYLAESRTRGEASRLSYMRHTDGVLTIAGMESAFQTQQSTDIAYQQSCSMVAWLDYHYPNAWNTLLSQMAVGRSFEFSLYQATGLTPEQWLTKWRTGIPTYLLVLGFLASPAVFSPLSLLLVIVAVRRILQKRKEAREAEEAVERDTPTPTVPALKPYPYAALAGVPILDDIPTPPQCE